MAQSVSVKASAQNESLVETVVTAVADCRDTDPLSLEPLYTAIDPDSLETLLDRDTSPQGQFATRVSFTYAGCEVVVSADGDVRVTESTDHQVN